MIEKIAVEQPLLARRIFSVPLFSKRNPTWSESSLRWLIHCAKERHGAKSLSPANGLDIAIIRKQGRVFIDEERFFDWLESGTSTSNRPCKRGQFLTNP